MAQHWRERARCKGMETEFFFPGTEQPDAAPVCRAKAVCLACPVQATCLAEALAAHDVYGVRAAGFPATSVIVCCAAGCPPEERRRPGRR